MEIQEEDFLDNGSLSGEVQDELYEHYRFNGRQRPGAAADRQIPGTIHPKTPPANRVQNAIRAQNVLVNDAPVNPNYKVRPGDVIRVVMPTPVREDVLIPENIPLNIVYEDDDLLVVDKPAGMVVHPGHGNYTGTLVNALAYRFQQLPSTGGDGPSGAGPPDRQGYQRVAGGGQDGTCHEPTWPRQFFEHSISRRYKALVWGDFVEDEGTYRGNIGRNPSNRLQMAVFPDGEAGKPAVTHFRVVQRFGYVTLVECRLETGRTHQIRAHFSFHRHPLFSDARYGGDQILKGTISGAYKLFIRRTMEALPRQALHAELLGFVHPITGQYLEFTSPLPEDFRTALRLWEDYAKESMAARRY